MALEGPVLRALGERLVEARVYTDGRRGRAAAWGCRGDCAVNVYYLAALVPLSIMVVVDLDRDAAASGAATTDRRALVTVVAVVVFAREQDQGRRWRGASTRRR